MKTSFASPILLAALVVWSSACAGARRELPQLVEERPLSVLVVPMTNETTDLQAPDIGHALLAIPIAERGYYVFPPALTEALLADLGLPDAGLVHQLPPQEFAEEFGADAVLFVTVEDWSTKYLGIWSSVTVAFRYSLYSTRTGEELWSARSRAVNESGVSLNPIAMAISAALVATTQSYPPLVSQAHFAGLNQLGFSLPAGPHHPGHEAEYAAVGTAEQQTEIASDQTAAEGNTR